MMSFEIKKTKTCRNHLKKWYYLSHPIDETFLSFFRFLGEPKITNVKQYLPDALVMFQFRSYEFGIEVSGGIDGKELYVIFPKHNKETEEFFEMSILEWTQTYSSCH